jgi:hypothetical protein
MRASRGQRMVVIFGDFAVKGNSRKRAAVLSASFVDDGYVSRRMGWERIWGELRGVHSTVRLLHAVHATHERGRVDQAKSGSP